jgi:hypothetical protein
MDDSPLELRRRRVMSIRKRIATGAVALSPVTTSQS